MTTWTQMSIDAFKAAIVLHRKGYDRSAVSRAYYAAYAAVTVVLVKDPSVTFAHHRPNPDHGRLLDHMQHAFQMQGILQDVTNRLKGHLRDLRRLRVRADYAPTEAIGSREAEAAVRMAEKVIQELGMPL